LPDAIFVISEKDVDAERLSYTADAVMLQQLMVAVNFQKRTAAAKAAAIPVRIYGTTEAVLLRKTSKAGHLSASAPIRHD
jgi:hypothetical protein